MRPDPITEGRRWLEQAGYDLAWAQDLAERGGYHIACFLAQQVAEKALKAFLYATGEEVVLGHSVQRLASEAAEQRAGFAEKARRWSMLDGYYIPTRYPNGLPGSSIPALVYTQEAARSAVGLARETVEFVSAEIDRLEQLQSAAEDESADKTVE